MSFRIGIDAHAIGSRQTGNETYITNLVNELLKIESQHQFILFFTHKEARERWVGIQNETRTQLLWPGHPLIRMPIVMPWKAKNEKLDLLHVQYAAPPFIKTPLVTTVHDISFEHHPEYFTRKEVMQFKATIPRAARKARRIFTVSEYSKRDIAETYNIDPAKIVVTYDGVGADFKPVPESQRNVTLQRYNIKQPYFLAVGNLQPRKNIARLISAYDELRNGKPKVEHQLIIVGKKAWKYNPIFSEARSSRWSDDIIFTDYVPVADLAAIYSGATVFIYPTLFEGFGLPPLEAMACGTPVITSNCSSLPEVVGEAAIKINPFDVSEIAQAMIELVGDHEKVDSLIKKGKRQAAKFKWSDCARVTLRTYEEVCEEEASNVLR